MENNGSETVKVVESGHKRTSSVGSTHVLSPTHLSSNSGTRLSSSTVSSGSGQEKHFYREKFIFDADVYMNNPAYSDFQFKVGESEIGLSAIVLSANSPFISYKINTENCKRLDVSALELDIDQVQEMIRPLYNGRLSLSSRNLLNYLMFSTLFEFQWIFDCCLVYFTEHIKPDLVFDFLELGLRSQNHLLDSYKVVMRLCGKYLEEGNNMQLTCNHIKESNKTKKLSRDVIDFIVAVDSNNVIDVISLILTWLKLDSKNMDTVPALLDSFDFSEVFKQNEELAMSFFTHIITGDYTAEVRMQIMNLSFQSFKNMRPAKNSKFRMSRLKSVKKDDD